jgi:hypothetical protein
MVTLDPFGTTGGVLLVVVGLAPGAELPESPPPPHADNIATSPSTSTDRK